MHETIAGLLGSYGYAILFVLVALESLGVPLPGETALFTAATLAAYGRLSIAAVVGTAMAAAILGDNGGYWIGREAGGVLVRRFGRVVRVNQAKLERARAFFARHGPKAVFFGRFVALLRTWAAMLAGAAHMPYPTFMFYNAAGGVCWALVVGALGYLFGRTLPRLDAYVGQATLAVALLVALIVALSFGYRALERNGARPVAALERLWQRFIGMPGLMALKTRHPRAWAFVAARFTRGDYLGLHLTIGLVVSLAGLWAFGAILEDVVHGDPLTQLDLALLAWFQAHATPLGYHVAQAISFLGSPAVIALLALGVSAVLASSRQRLLLAGWIAALVGAGVLTEALKLVIRRPRPPEAMLFLNTESWSFPSGHAMGSLVGYGMLAYLAVVLWVKRPRLKGALVLGAALLVAAVGLSRLYLGVHYFSDVVGGYAAGVLWLAACISGLEVARRWPGGGSGGGGGPPARAGRSPRR